MIIKNLQGGLMKKAGKIIGIFLVGILLLSGCGNAKLKNGEEKVVSFKKGNITADTLYKTLKEKYGLEVLLDLLDHKILDKEYKTTTEETTQVENQINQIKQNYQNDESSYLAAIQQYFGVDSEDDLKSLLSLEYKRSQAVEDYVEENIDKTEVEEYYKNHTVGKIKARHILIKPETTEDMSEEEKENAEQKALEEAKEIIDKLKDGKKFASLAKKYSDDTGTKEDGGLLEEFDNNSSMDENFLEAAAKLEVGKYTEEPVKSQYGYHIILKESEKEKPKLKKVEDDIRKTLANEKLDNDNSLYYESLMGYREKKGLKFSDSQMKKEYKKHMQKLIENATSNSSNN